MMEDEKRKSTGQKAICGLINAKAQYDPHGYISTRIPKVRN
jgi:hypothetical protein